ncbi:hypothetical protein [Acidicapsa ligni]|uniref:hypothetical protein n=1 Tax=Acidicapsa ligni TaxID=542300 RepID=UPI0021E0071E|nr:hypothetical protein [Acidicapsa ligni]
MIKRRIKRKKSILLQGGDGAEGRRGGLAGSSMTDLGAIGVFDHENNGIGFKRSGIEAENKEFEGLSSRDAANILGALRRRF